MSFVYVIMPHARVITLIYRCSIVQRNAFTSLRKNRDGADRGGAGERAREFRARAMNKYIAHWKMISLQMHRKCLRRARDC